MCYAYLRTLYDRKEYDTDEFNVFLEWSEVFRKYTSIARQQTGERHASQIASPEDVANTVPWEEWRAAARNFIEYYFEVQGNSVKVHDCVAPVRPHPHGTRLQRHTIEDPATGAKTEKVFQPAAPPWWNTNGKNPRAPRRPNLRELRDAAMVAVYSLLASIRLDWAPTEVVARGPQNKPANPTLSKNVLVVDSLQQPSQLGAAYFGQCKNRKKFFQSPLGFPVPR